MNIKLLLFFNVFFIFSVQCQKWIDVSETIKLDEKIYSRKTGDLFSGIMTEENNSGIIISRYSVVNGELNGPVIKFYENGDTLLKGNYKFGNLDGDIFSYYSPSAAWLENIGFEITKVPYCESKATYINGVRSGKSIYYFENG